MATTAHHEILIVGGGTAGISVAARLKKAKVDDVAVMDPATTHYYQALWTLVGGGRATAKETARPQQKVMPKDVTWIRQAAVEIDPEEQTVTAGNGDVIGYDFLVVCPGIQLDWDRTPGLADTLGIDGVSSNYTFELAPKTWEFIQNTTSGTAVFTMPGGPIKCAGAPQKIAYLASHYWEQQGVLDAIDVHLVLPTPKMFGVKVFSDVLEGVVERYGITVHFESEVTEVRPETRDVVITHHGDDGRKSDLGYDMMHATPHQSAPDWVKQSPLSTGDANGYVDVDKHTHQHVRWPNIFSLGDAGSTPNSKTGAAIRKQAPVATENILAARAGQELTGHYTGYASCPLTTARNRMLLAEFDYTMEPTPSIPVINTKKERYDMWLLKRYGLPFMYWNLMLKGRI